MQKSSTLHAKKRRKTQPEALCTCGKQSCDGLDRRHKCQRCMKPSTCKELWRDLKSGGSKKGTCINCRTSASKTNEVSKKVYNKVNTPAMLCCQCC